MNRYRRGRRMRRPRRYLSEKKYDDRKKCSIFFTNTIFCGIINKKGIRNTKMKCLYCGCEDSKVIDSRSADEGRTIRRRRECVRCGKRFTTYETIEDTPVLVVKANGTRQSFDAGKIKNGIVKACEKRPVSMSAIDELVDGITKRVYNSMEQEISSKAIGEMVMEALKDLDEVAYVRYASVYRSFKDISSFMAELQKLMDNKK